ncbi:hypothetical protein T4C_1267 [Trichinella pseudospiralis]|uniref:Uncharacterized protein n=1 Tax=Trichinella pseudospiralis TaxID=6337 RepID=A0A0V1K2X7_TRIPS|nr:hypothetical protein T4C_1267 [Trichinella pseudospiralis]
MKKLVDGTNVLPSINVHLELIPECLELQDVTVELRQWHRLQFPQRRLRRQLLRRRRLHVCCFTSVLLLQEGVGLGACREHFLAELAPFIKGSFQRLSIRECVFQCDLSTVRFRILRIHRTQGIPDRYFRGPCLELLYHLTNDTTQAPLLDLLPSLDCLGFHLFNRDPKSRLPASPARGTKKC